MKEFNFERAGMEELVGLLEKAYETPGVDKALIDRMQGRLTDLAQQAMAYGLNRYERRLKEGVLEGDDKVKKFQPVRSRNNWCWNEEKRYREPTEPYWLWCGYRIVRHPEKKKRWAIYTNPFAPLDGEYKTLHDACVGINHKIAAKNKKHLTLVVE